MPGTENCIAIVEVAIAKQSGAQLRYGMELYVRQRYVLFCH